VETDPSLLNIVMIPQKDVAQMDTHSKAKLKNVPVNTLNSVVVKMVSPPKKTKQEETVVVNTLHSDVAQMELMKELNLPLLLLDVQATVPNLNSIVAKIMKHQNNLKTTLVVKSQI